MLIAIKRWNFEGIIIYNSTVLISPLIKKNIHCDCYTYFIIGMGRFAKKSVIPGRGPLSREQLNKLHVFCLVYVTQ